MKPDQLREDMKKIIKDSLEPEFTITAKESNEPGKIEMDITLTGNMAQHYMENLERTNRGMEALIQAYGVWYEHTGDCYVCTRESFCDIGNILRTKINGLRKDKNK